MTAATAMSSLLIIGVLTAGLASAAPGYTVTFNEVGLPAGTSWTVTFNGVPVTSTAAKISFTSVAGGFYCPSVSTPGGGTSVQYVPSSVQCMSVNAQTEQSIVYTKQDQVAFTVLPSTSDGYTSPSGTNYYNDGTILSVNAGHYVGFTFVKWKSSVSGITFGNATANATTATIAGAGTITGNFKSATNKVNFVETGLPAGTHWSVTFGGLAHSGSTATLSVGAHAPGNYGWSVGTVAAGTGTQYAPTIASGSTYVPYVLTEEIIFVKQFQVTFAVSPASSGSVNPSGVQFITNESELPIEAGSSGSWQFSKWTSGTTAEILGAPKDNSTNLTVTGHGTVTANFVSGSPCSTCTFKFVETGLPAGTGWGVSFNSSFYTSTTQTITLPGLPATYYSWSVSDPIGSSTPGVAYYATPNSGTIDLYQTTQTIVFTKEAYVNFGSAGPSGGGYQYLGYGNGYYPIGWKLPLVEQNNDYVKFSSWSANTSKLVIGASGAAATTLTINGPGTVTVTFTNVLRTLHFFEVGLAKHTGWGISINGGYYSSSGTELNVTGVPAGSYGWAMANQIAGAKAGTAYFDLTGTPGINTAYQLDQMVVYEIGFNVVIGTTGSTGGGMNPYGSFWYLNNTIIPVAAGNQSGVNFTAWSGSPAGSFKIAASTHASTTVEIKGPGRLTAAFV